MDEQLEYIATLEDNWDGEGAVKIQQEVIDNSQSLIEMIQILTTVEFDLSPTPYGTITIDMYKQDVLLSIEVGKTTISYWYSKGGLEEGKVDKLNPKESHEAIKKIIKKYFA